MNQNLTQKIITTHLERGKMSAGSPISLHIDQTLTQDAKGTLPLPFENAEDGAFGKQGRTVKLANVKAALAGGIIDWQGGAASRV